MRRVGPRPVQCSVAGGGFSGAVSDYSSPRTIAITGASSGLGRALAVEFAGPHTTLLLHGRDAARLRAVGDACEAAGSRVVLVVADIVNTDDFMGQWTGALQASPPDLLIINAGVTNSAGPDGETWDDIARVIDVNFRGALATLSCALPVFRAARRGQVALISSLAARVGMPVTPTYAATKAALSSYGDSMRSLLAPQGIALSVVSPGFVDTPMSAGFPAGTPFMISPEVAARRIRRGLADNRGRISFPWPLALGMWLLGMLPAPMAQIVLRWTGYGR